VLTGAKGHSLPQRDSRQSDVSTSSCCYLRECEHAVYIEQALRSNGLTEALSVECSAMALRVAEFLPV